MDLKVWIFYGLMAMAGGAIVRYLYGRREMPGRGRRILALLRWGTLALLLLLLLDPELSVPELTVGGERVQVLLDRSLSMSVPLGPGATETRWDRAVSEARRISGDREIYLFGADLQIARPAELEKWAPDAPQSRLAPALRAAAEGGARRVVVLTDGVISDLAEVDRILPLLGLELEVRTLPTEPVGNLAISELEAPSWAEAGKSIEIRVGITAEGEVPDSVELVLSEDGAAIITQRVPTPEPGRTAIVTLEVEPTPSAGGGLTRYDIELTGTDPVPDDDRRSTYLYIDERPAGLALVSFRPDWEPRFLYPILEQALGLPIHGYLQADSRHYLELGFGAEAGGLSEEAEVAGTVERSKITVLHGLDGEAPAWAHEAAANGERVLLFPGGYTRSLPLSIDPGREGEWEVVGELPASPLLDELSGMRLVGLPPLSRVYPAELGGQSWAPLMVREEGDRGAALPLIAGVQDGERRAVGGLGEGFWGWAIRGGPSRESYRNLWSVVGGWLLEEDEPFGTGPVRPLERVVRRGSAPSWVVHGPEGEEPEGVTLQLRRDDGRVALDTIIEPVGPDTVSTPLLEPGHYTYHLTSASGAELGEGELTVESYSPEFQKRPHDLGGLVATGTATDWGEDEGRGTPLHTEPWPYLAIVILVSTEWVFRRRWGLR